MGIYKRGNVWWYKFMIDGKLYHESTRQGNSKVARDVETKARQAVLTGEPLPGSAPTLAKFITERIEPYAKPLRSWLWYRAGIRALLLYEPFATASLTAFDGPLVSGFCAWRQSQGLVPDSINSNLRVLRAILNHAVEWGIIRRTAKIELLTGESRRERVVDSREEAKYLAACTTPLLHDVATVLLDTGLRPDELHRMRWENIVWENSHHGAILVTEGKTKAARRSVPMTPRVRTTLERRWREQGSPEVGWCWPSATKTGHIDHSTTKKQHYATLKKSGVRPFVLYSLRHTFLTRLGESGCDAWTLARIAGHSSISIGMHYVHVGDERVLDAMSAHSKRLENIVPEKSVTVLDTNVKTAPNLRSHNSSQLIGNIAS